MCLLCNSKLRIAVSNFVKIKATTYAFDLCLAQMLDCVFVSPLPTKPASLGFAGGPIFSSLLRYIFSIPCKLNNAQIFEHLSDLRTLQVKSCFT